MSFPGSAEQQNRMMYTAVSRPRKKLVILSSGVPTVTAERTTTVSADTNRMNARLAAAREAREVLKDKDKGCKK